MKIAVVHNLPPGGARRRLANQLRHMEGPIVEICLQTATPITPDAVIVPLRLLAPAVDRLLRPPLRYVDQVRLEIAWRRVARLIRSSGADAIYLNPCRFLQAPPVLHGALPPVLYFCDEPRRVNSEAEARATINPGTVPLYAPLYARERALDQATTARAGRLATNSRYTAREIERAYARLAAVVTMGVPEDLLSTSERGTDQGFLLSVGALIPTKGHDLVLQTAARATTRRPVIVVAPRDGRDEERRLSEIAGRLGVELTVRVGITDRELGDLFRTAHATLYLAHREPLGLASLEAQACGSPMIVAAEGGLPETIVEGLTGWQAPRDPQAVAAILGRLDDPEVRAQVSEQARRHAKRWNWNTSAREIGVLLAELLAPSSRPVGLPGELPSRGLM